MDNIPLFDTTVLFIHGFAKTKDDWAIIQKHLGGPYNIHCIDINNTCYVRPVQDICQEIDDSMSTFHETKIIVVAHSYGAFYAIGLSRLNKFRYNKLLLIEPTLKTEEYQIYLTEKYAKTPNEIDKYKIENFDTFPDYRDLTSNIIIIVHINVKIREEHETVSKIERCNQLCNKNAKSLLCLHVNKGHMLHHTVPDKIISTLHICTYI
jgi:pimeloyl-ACP methyl ester carboxylesterase